MSDIPDRCLWSRSRPCLGQRNGHALEQHLHERLKLHRCGLAHGHRTAECRRGCCGGGGGLRAEGGRHHTACPATPLPVAAEDLEPGQERSQQDFVMVEQTMGWLTCQVRNKRQRIDRWQVQDRKLC